MDTLQESKTLHFDLNAAQKRRCSAHQNLARALARARILGKPSTDNTEMNLTPTKQGDKNISSTEHAKEIVPPCPAENPCSSSSDTDTSSEPPTQGGDNASAREHINNKVHPRLVENQCGSNFDAPISQFPSFDLVTDQEFLNGPFPELMNIDSQHIANPETAPLPSSSSEPQTLAPVPPEPVTQHESAQDANPAPMDLDLDLREKEIEAADQEDSFKFQSIENWFNGLANPTPVQAIQYETAKFQNELRLARSRRRNALIIQEKEHGEQLSTDVNGEVEENQDEDSDQELFCRQDNAPRPSSGSTQAEQSSDKTGQAANTATQAVASQVQRKMPKRQNRLSAEERRRSVRVGLSPSIEKSERNKYPKRSAKKRGAEVIAAGAASQNKRTRTKNQNESNNNMTLSTFQSNVIEEAQASSSMGGPAIFSEKDKKKALIQLLSSIPSQDLEEAKSDGKLIIDASRKFTKSARSDGEGGWKVKGLKTSIHGYQLLGVTFMRDREDSPQPPFGGLLCDEMGFGKTIQALVNIIEGAPKDPEDPVKTTLVVAPSHLTKHWMDEMKMHCNLDAIGRVVEFHANARLSTLDDVKYLQDHKVVVTTYDEVRRSYPVFKEPKEVPNNKGLDDLWEEANLMAQIGPLHRIKFQRIILDEAHMIKNHQSKISLAVRGLTGKHKWVLSGTPIQNSMDEFYPLFDFIGVPHMQSRSDFINKYCCDEDGQTRLTNLLRAFMYRRTHSSRLFNLPIVRLPNSVEKTMKVKFCMVEHAIYTAIAEDFLEKINDLAHAQNFEKAQTRCFLTMILKLRMFCSHLLTVQERVKPLLTAQFMHKLTSLAREDSLGEDNPSASIVEWLNAVKKDYKHLVKKRQEEGEQQEQQTGPSFFTKNQELIDRFFKRMSDLHRLEDWIERFDRTVCPKCHSNEPESPVVTSCLHLYCEECICLLDEEGQKSETGRPLCTTCGCSIEEAIRCEEINVEEPSTPAANTAKAKSKRAVGKKGGKSNNAKDDEKSDEQTDWILACGAHMPSAKLATIRELITNWKEERKSVKVVVFTQFLGFVQIVTAMCKEKRWNPTCFTGKMTQKARQQSLKKFNEDPKVTVLIATLRTGGLGLDMTAANKCILVDLWWNEATQNQAFCRILRLGQTREVECVKLIVEKTIDDYMVELQSDKTVEITSTMGEDALKNRDNMITLLKMFAHVVEDEDGRLKVQPKSRRRPRGRVTDIILGNAPSTTITSGTAAQGKKNKKVEVSTGTAGETNPSNIIQSPGTMAAESPTEPNESAGSGDFNQDP